MTISTWAKLVLMLAIWAIAPARLAASDLTVASGERRLQVAAIAANVVRVRIVDDAGDFPDESWSVPREVRDARVEAKVDGTTLSTGQLRVIVDPASLAIRVQDAVGRVILADAQVPLSRSGAQFTLNKQLTQGEKIFGLGDKTGPIDRRGRAFTNWNTDTYGFGSSNDPTYKSIPFYISSGGPGGAYGVLLDNTFRSWFDFGQRREDELSFGAEAGPIDYYIVAGPRIADVVHGYTGLTGRAPMFPRWALGYQQSRWSYMSEAEVRTLADRFRRERNPIDVIWLDIDYQFRNRPFTIDRESFPRFEAMVHDLDQEGIKTVAIADLHVAAVPGEDYRPYDEGVEQDHFLKNSDGTLYVAPVWPGPSVFPDFTRAQTREWWGGLHAALIDAGVAGIWDDMNEPAIFETPTKTMPLDVQHRFEGDGLASRTTNHREIHNVYGMENTRATYEGLVRLQPDERPFVMTRASFAGGQRYAATWTGDNSSTWDHLKLSVAQTLNLGLSGFPWAGADVGGFTGGPSAELLTRWFQFATFAPIFRDHSQKDVPRAEPWVHGEDHLAIRRRFVEERYRLAPYIYGVAEQASRSGDPIMRPIFYDYPEVLGSDCDMSMQFTLGARILVAGSPKPESPYAYSGCLPKGGWYDYWTGRKVTPVEGSNGAVDKLELVPDVATLPVFVRAGTILPKQPLVQSLSERPSGALELHVYPGPECTGEIYLDDGHSLGYARGDYLRQRVECTMDGDRLKSLAFGKREGRFPPWWNGLEIIVHDRNRYVVAHDGNRLAPRLENGASVLDVRDLPNGGKIQFDRVE